MTSALSELDSLLASFSGSAAPSGQDLNQLLSNLDLNYGPTSSPPTSIPAATAATPAPTTGPPTSIPAATAATDILECQIKTPQKPKTNLKSAAGKLSEGIDQMVASLTYPASKAEAGSASMPGVSSVGYGQEPSAQAGLGGYAMPVGERVSHASAPAPGHQNVQYAPGPAGVAHMYAGLPVCKYCSKAIPGECILAMNSYYHPHHFVCANCEKPLEVSNFYALHELPHCASCYAALSSSLCARCLQPCRPGEGIQALGKHWHPEHFTCSQCTAQLTSRFFNKNGQPHCETCATYSSDVCGACNQPIRGGGVSALGRKWHPEHLVCSVCRAPAFHSGMVYERGGNVYCKTHYDASSHLPKCQSCSGEISLSQTPVVIGAKSWHPEHFKCNFCWASLTPDSFRISSAQDPYCSPCFDKLF